MSLTVREETPLQDEIEALLKQSDAVAAKLYPDAYRQPIDPKALAAPGVHLFVARREGEAAGCCALIARDAGAAELKRMIVGERFRRQGVGAALLRAAEQGARDLGVSVIRMEVGVKNEEGYQLYLSAGFVACEAFAPYQPSPISRFLEKRLS
ncbi:GNAT family N-acetyltransferase [Terrarubrum flagellatum]|uniref:GNAT family N-acetyltransferase n=1 Tax=Terrirubrum flagellatum TaxID=2895980 RepID=UPI0031455E60